MVVFDLVVCIGIEYVFMTNRGPLVGAVCWRPAATDGWWSGGSQIRNSRKNLRPIYEKYSKYHPLYLRTHVLDPCERFISFRIHIQLLSRDVSSIPNMFSPKPHAAALRRPAPSAVVYNIPR